jgi:hypothetical protein
MKSLAPLVVFALLYCFHINAQEASKIQQEIDEQVWFPFIETYNAFDGEGFNALHTEDVLRAGPWGIRLGDEYRENILENTAAAKAAGRQRNIAFRFEHRVAREHVAYEVGYYRVRSKSDGEERTFIGRFDVVLRKVDGVWKIAQDWDVDEINGRKLTEADFVGDGTRKIYEK